VGLFAEKKHPTYAKGDLLKDVTMQNFAMHAHRRLV
jgi:hypothetical protein